MKRRLSVLLTILILLFILCPVTVSAQTYTLSGTDMSVQIDDTMWYVFTRDNLSNNHELDELGLTYEEVLDSLYSNSAYLDAFAFNAEDSFIRLEVIKSYDNEGVVNLSNYTATEVLEHGKQLLEHANFNSSFNCNLHRGSPYKFLKFEGKNDTGLETCMFYTIVNKDIYILTFNSNTPFGEVEYKEIDRIVNSIRFQVDTTLKEPKNNTSWIKSVIKAVISGLIAIISFVIRVVTSRKKKKKADKEDPFSVDNNYNAQDDATLK